MHKLDEKALLSEYYEEILNIINTIKVGIFITDGDGNVLMVNKESERTGGRNVEELLGKNMSQLQDEGYVDVSSVLKAIETKDEYRMIQNLGDGSSIYLTDTQYFK